MIDLTEFDDVDDDFGDSRGMSQQRASRVVAVDEEVRRCADAVRELFAECMRMNRVYNDDTTTRAGKWEARNRGWKLAYKMAEACEVFGEALTKSADALAKRSV